MNHFCDNKVQGTENGQRQDEPNGLDECMEEVSWFYQEEEIDECPCGAIEHDKGHDFDEYQIHCLVLDEDELELPILNVEMCLFFCLLADVHKGACSDVVHHCYDCC